MKCFNPYHAKEGFEIIYRNIINEYLKYEYSLIPIDREKKPYIYWKPFQYKRAITEDVFGWYDIFCGVNIGIVTGNISNLAVIDVDDLNLLPELEELLPYVSWTSLLQRYFNQKKLTGRMNRFWSYMKNA